MEANKKRDLAAISSIPLIMTLGNSMLIPILPSLSRTLQVSSFQISLLITVYSVVAIILIPIAGYLSDRFGRKKIIIPSLLVAAAGGLLCGVAPWFAAGMLYPVILIGRLVQGIGAAGASPIVMPLVGDMYEDEKDVSSALGIIETSNTLGKVVSPILGSLLALWAWYTVFLSIPVFCLVSILLVVFLVKVPVKDEKQEPVKFPDFLRALGRLAKQEGRWLSAIFAIGVIAMFILFGVLFYLSNVLEEQFGIDGILKGSLLAVPLSALCLASYLTGKVIGENKQRMKWLSATGLAILLLALIALAWFGGATMWLLFVFIAIGGIGIGIALPCMDALITEGIDKKQRGTVSAVYSSMRFIGVAAGPPALSVAMKWTAAAVFYSLGGLAAAGLLLALCCIKPKKQ